MNAGRAQHGPGVWWRSPGAVLMCVSLLVCCLAACCGPEAPAEQRAMADADGRVWPAKLADVVERARDRFGVPTVSVSERGALPPGTIVVDVRTGPETQVSVIEGARRLEDEAAREAFLASPPDAPVLVYCTAGWRSAEFTRDLRAAGVEAWNLEGGVCAWALYGQPIIGADGQPTKRIHGFDEDWAACVPDGYEAVW